jgi:hypothetical protein
MFAQPPVVETVNIPAGGNGCFVSVQNQQNTSAVSVSFDFIKTVDDGAGAVQFGFSGNFT